MDLEVFFLKSQFTLFSQRREDERNAICLMNEKIIISLLYRDPLAVVEVFVKLLNPITFLNAISSPLTW